MISYPNILIAIVSITIRIRKIVPEVLKRLLRALRESQDDVYLVAHTRNSLHRFAYGNKYARPCLYYLIRFFRYCTGKTLRNYFNFRHFPN